MSSVRRHGHAIRDLTLPWLGVLLVLILGAAYIASFRPQVALLTIIMAGTFLGVRALRLRLVDAVLLLSPFMFFPAGLPTLNVAASDLVFPLLFISVVSASLRADADASLIRQECSKPLKFSAYFLALVTGLTLLASLRDPDFLLRAAVIDLLKLVVVLAYLVVIIGALVTTSRSGLLQSMRLWVWLAAGQAVGSLVGFVPSDGSRSLGYFQDPNLYAGYLLVSLSVAFVLVAQRALPLWPIIMACILGGILATGSRGGILSTSLFVAAALAGVALTRVGVLMTGVLFLLASVLLLAPWQDWARSVPGGERLLTSSQSGSDPRFSLWSKAIELWTDNPVAGIGLGQFTRFSAGLTPFHGGRDGQVAHNTFLSLAAETGILGLGVFLFGCLFLIRRLWRAEHLSWSTRWSLLLGLIAIASTMMTINLQNLRYVWIFAAITWVATSSRGPLSAEVSPAADLRDQREGQSAARRSHTP